MKKYPIDLAKTSYKSCKRLTSGHARQMIKTIQQNYAGENEATIHGRYDKYT